ncbi:hypothetical protein LTR78_005308 [Recurvomyces mirabilis]|uniref:Glycoside hydrolase 131 catalytic N-terminal domain-containing protein n=1 Tax=Recurvomyces mirabilis TaxID=574656 RepID=A0AAE0WNA6_9PEZI|nr:hypothetical protein LTR78_005308 [Recurvomyces mirabilis]KAK5157858.1 hypothetical protein LTS14_003780 [Recurvomyces mirabilis]
MKTGTPYNNATKGKIPATQTLRIESSTNGGVSETTLFETYYTLNDWHNFALELDFNQNTITGYYSKNHDALKVVIPTKANNNAGGGLYHFGILKLPASGTGNGSVTISGYQPSGINEGQYYGGIFIEDTSAQPVTTSVSSSGWKL